MGGGGEDGAGPGAGQQEGEVSPGHRDAGYSGPLPGAQSGLRQWSGQQISEQCRGQLRPGGGAETR